MSGELKVGTTLHGFCGGAFGRDAYGNIRIEAIGKDWVVARDTDCDEVLFYQGDPNTLLGYDLSDPEQVE